MTESSRGASPSEAATNETKLYEEAEAFFAQDGWDGAEPHVVAVAFLKEYLARTSSSGQGSTPDKL